MFCLKLDNLIPPRYPFQVREGQSPIGLTMSGAARVEVLYPHITLCNRICIFFSIFLVAFAYGLDSTLRYAYQPYVSAYSEEHDVLSTINVVTGVIAVAAQPGAARIADIFGRIQLLILSVCFYSIGTAIQAASTKVTTFAVGTVLYKLGYTVVVLLLEILVADITTLRARVFFSYIPPSSYLFIPWVAPIITTRLNKQHTSWRWAIGMFAIIYAICVLPLILAIIWVIRKAKKAGRYDRIKTPGQKYGGWALMKILFWQLDIIGISLVTSVLALILTPLTAAGGDQPKTHWTEARILAPIVIGILLIPVFIWWSTKAPYPVLPFQLFKQRAVWGSLGIALTLNFAWGCQGDYLFSVLIMAFNESQKSATQITSVYSFVSVSVGIVAGLVIFKARHLKPIVIIGTIPYLTAFGLFIFYTGAPAPRLEHFGIIAVQVLLGIGGGLFPYPALAGIQSATKHENVASVTALYFAIYHLGGTLGSTVSSTIWTQILPGKLKELLGDRTLAWNWYNDPSYMLKLYPSGTPTRDAVAIAVKHVQLILCITGLCVCVPLVYFSTKIRNTKLPDTQAVLGAEGYVIELDDVGRTAAEENQTKLSWANWTRYVKKYLPKYCGPDEEAPSC
ncbi:ferrioxamine B transporter [Neocucurbitaria cava]|uniref:Ferrioxamine B transporter n=1 Tax=Neocucurbitaria cava TaxID=798079 RepID=A0A9W9CR47_9PLEO|nr:ferrioxamine B transporter [Neocucurbitaria cava]